MLTLFKLNVNVLLVLALLYNSGRCKPVEEEAPDYLDTSYVDGELQNDNVLDSDLPDYVQGKDTRNPSGSQADGGNDPALNDSENEDDDDDSDLKILTQPQTFLSKPGHVLRLPCDVKNIGEMVRMWYKEKDQLYMGEMPLTVLPDAELEANGSLLISNVSTKHAGQYKCLVMVSTTHVPTVFHHVEVTPNEVRVEITKQVTPRITRMEILRNNTKPIKEGSELHLVCEASGFPKPRITWHLDSQKLDIEGEHLIIESVSRKDSGLYRCLADNGLSNPAHKAVQIDVQFKPHIHVDQQQFNTEEGETVELRCEVHSNPSAVVNWQRNNVNLKDNSFYKLTSTKSPTHVQTLALVIVNLTKDTFGSYSCYAVNVEGKANKTVWVYQQPAIIEFVKDQNSKYPVLDWIVKSRAPVEEQEVLYRRQGEEHWKKAVPSVHATKDGLYEVKQKLQHLTTGRYEAKLRLRNNHGWSEFSEIIAFEGAKHNHNQSKHLKRPKNHKDNGHKVAKDVNSLNKGTEASQLNDAETHAVKGTTGAATSPSLNFLASIVCVLPLLALRQ